LRRRGGIHIGTSGWHYSHWRGPFYPDGLPVADFLRFYAGRFHTVEINNSFYRLPEAETFRRWREAVPPRFVFAVKASRYITHMKKLKDPEEPLRLLFSRAETMGDRLGPLLFQLPPRWRFNPLRLKDFLQALPRGYRFAFEFRDPSWFTPEACDMLSAVGAALCIYDFAGTESPRTVTADFVYIRLHGPGAAYRGRYGTAALAEWAGAISAWSRQGKDVYCYFDNDEAGFAPEDALRLKEMTEGAA